MKNRVLYIEVLKKTISKYSVYSQVVNCFAKFLIFNKVLFLVDYFRLPDTLVL